MSEIIYKQAPVNLEPAENDGYLIGYANMYNVKDLQGDISAPNSFIKTVTERKAKIKIYRNHDSNQFVGVPVELKACLLYTSDAADERSSVDLGGRRIIKKKTNKS